MQGADINKVKILDESVLFKKTRTELLSMLYEEQNQQNIRQSQAAHELSRRNESTVLRLHLAFGFISALAACASAFAAFSITNVSTNCSKEVLTLHVSSQ